MHPVDLGPDLTRHLLDRIGAEALSPTPDGLRDLHRAFLDAVPYENLQIQAGIPTTLDPIESAERIVAGRGGYCFHMNGALGSLLHTLGFRVRFAIGNPEPGDAESWGRHVLALVDFDDEGRWLADVGIGDGFRDPIPLRVGAYDQPPFRYALSEADSEADRDADGAADGAADGDADGAADGEPRARWRWQHDPRGSFEAFDLDPDSQDWGVVEKQHLFLSTSPSSPFVQKLTVQARRDDHVVVLRGCVLTTKDAEGTRARDLDDEREWSSALVDVFGIRPGAAGLTAEVRAALWRRTRAVHEKWVDAGRP